MSTTHTNTMRPTGAGSTRGPASRRGRCNLTHFILHVVTLWRSFVADSDQPLVAAPARCGRMRWTSPSPVEVAKSSACSTTRPSWDFGTSRLRAESRWSLRVALSLDSCCGCYHPCAPQTATNCLTIPRLPLWQKVRRPMHGGVQASSAARAQPLWFIMRGGAW